MINHWSERSAAADGYRETLYQHTSIDAEGKTIGRLEKNFSDGAQMSSSISYEFEEARKTVSDWKDALEDMQTRAGEALRKALDAQADIDDAQQKISALEAEAAKDDSPDPIISAKINGFMGMGGLKGDISDAEDRIAAAQRTVDDIRSEYQLKSSEAVCMYTISDLDGLYTVSAGQPSRGNPFSTVEEVRGDIFTLDPTTLAVAFDKAREDPANFPVLLDLLSEMTPEEIKDYFSDPAHQRDAILAVNPMNGDIVKRTKEISAWWNADLEFDALGRVKGEEKDAREKVRGILSKEQRDQLMKYAPGFVGNMQGVPYTHRSRANINLLHILSSDPADRKDVPFQVRDVPDHVRKAAHDVLRKQRELADAHRDTPIQVVTFEISYDGADSTVSHDGDEWNDVKSAASIGNLDTVDSVTYLTHGIGNSTAKSFRDHMDAAESLWDQQDSLYQSMGNTADGVTVKSTAVVGWMNYEAPKDPRDDGDLSVESNDKAHAGGKRYAQDLDTLNTLRGEKNIFLSTVAHSYGTDVTFSGMTEMKTQVDRAAFLGSAGLDENQVSGVNKGTTHLAVDPKNVYYTLAKKDGIAPLGYGTNPFGIELNPAKDTPSKLKGANEFTSDGGYDVSGKYWQDTDGHSLFEKKDTEGYLSTGSSSLNQTGMITTGHEGNIGRLIDYQVGKIEYRGTTPVYVSETVTADMQSPEDIARLKEYAADNDVAWDDVQKPQTGAE